MYEAPYLLDIEELAGTVTGDCGGCSTGGS